MKSLTTRGLLVLLLAGAICSFQSCKTQNDRQSVGEIPSIIISKEVIQPTSVVDELLESTSLIKLETRPEALIQEISKLIPLKDHLIIVDKKTSSILVFDQNGKFIRSIGSRGKAPGEYVDLTDVIWSDDLLYVLDIAKRKIHQYTLTNQHVSSIDMSLDFAGYMFEVNQNGYLLYRRNEAFPTAEGYNLIVANRQLDKLLDFGSEIPEILENRALIASQILSKHKDILYAIPPFDSLIYKVDSTGHILPAYRIDASPEYLARNYPIWKNTQLKDGDFDVELMVIRSNMEYFKSFSRK